MPRRALEPADLWRIPRVGAPVPSPLGDALLVPVTRYSLDTNQGVTRLWWVPANARDAGRGGDADPAVPLTAADVSSSQPAWSPDGTRVAFVRKPGASGKNGPQHADQPQLYVMNVAGGEPERLTDLPLGVADPKWFPDGRRIAFLTQIHPDAPTVEGTAKRAKELAEDPVQAHVTEDRVYRFWDRWLTREGVHHLFVVDVETRALTDLTPASRRRFDLMDPSGQYNISPQGDEIVFSATRSEPPHDPLLTGIYRVAVRGRGGKAAARMQALTPKGMAHAFTPIYSPDGRFIVYGFQPRYDFYADRVVLAALERESGQHIVLTEHWDVSPGAWFFAPDGKTLYLHAEHRGRMSLFGLAFARALKTGREKPRLLAKGGGLGLPRAAGALLFASRSALTAPPEVIRMNAQGKAARRLTGFTLPALKGIELGRVEEESFTGAGGRKVQMFLVSPPARLFGTATRGKKLPLVHLIHGGPHGAFPDEWHWRWNAQAVAATGRLAVLVNFHGSTGFGQRFTESILGRWGDQPYQDIIAATDLLIARGRVDKKRMAAAGGSYGGYLASWIASQTDRFACIVNHAGVCDFQPQYGTDITQDSAVETGAELYGKHEDLDRWNPMRHAAGFKSPMLVLHGMRDFRVPYGQALEIYNTYKSKGVPARLVIYPDENHWILKPKNSLHWYGEVFAWLDRWLGGRR